MFQIGDTLVSLDLAERFFCCDLSRCKGACCIEGDAGAPVDADEVEPLQQAIPDAAPYLTRENLQTLEQKGATYVDSDGDTVTQLVNDRDCAFSFLNPDGCLLCSLEAAAIDTGCPNRKPISCSLYPLRLTEYATFTAVNYHRWDICRPAEELGRKRGIRLYRFLRAPLVRRFGQEWYDELVANCELYLEQQQ